MSIPDAACSVAARMDDAGCPDAIMGFDASLRVAFVNDIAAGMLGVPVAALIGSAADQVATTGLFGLELLTRLRSVQHSAVA